MPDQCSVGDANTLCNPPHMFDFFEFPAFNKRPHQQALWHQQPCSEGIRPLLYGGACPGTADVSESARPALVVQNVTKFVRDGKAPAVFVSIVDAVCVHDYDGLQLSSREGHAPN